jgi:tetratricopeptide (TPR) repeat protein
MPHSNFWRLLALAVVALTLTGAAAAQSGITTGGSTQRPIFVTGNVAMEDGRPPSEKVDIQLVCQAQAQPQGKTDAKGKFNVQLGQDRHLSASDSSVGSAAASSGFGGALSGQTQVDGGSVLSLMGCSLRAALRGYRSDSFDLSRVRVGEPADAGTLILHSLANSKDLTITATSLEASKDARKAFEKGEVLLAKKQPAEAEKEFRKAVQESPRYAEAWQELGSLLQSQNKPAEAREAYRQALAADSRFAKPYLSLARLAAQERNWQDSLEKASALIQLEATAYPQAYYYQAVAQYNLRQNAEALASAKRAVELDTQHTVPLAEQLLGVIYSGQGDFKAAAEQFRGYLQHAPPGANLEPVKALLAEAEKKAQ